MISGLKYWAACAVPLACLGVAEAGPAASLATMARPGAGHAATAPLLVQAQASDPRITQLEEQVRQLTGKIEELNFMILQMQDQARKVQEDFEFRFQQLEEKRSDAGASASDDRRAEANADTGPATGPAASGSGPAPDTGRGDPPSTLGTITFDADGNPRNIGDDGGDVATAGDESPDDTTVAALPATDNPDELYRNAYSFILSGDYATAEAGFREHIDRFPDDPQASDAHYWLGEALLGMEEYRNAAETFLDASRRYPDSRKAPDMLLKLGVSLAALNQRDVACATYAEIGKRYRDVTPALKERVKAEQALAGC